MDRSPSTPSVCSRCPYSLPRILGWISSWSHPASGERDARGVAWAARGPCRGPGTIARKEQLPDHRGRTWDSHGVGGTSERNDSDCGSGRSGGTIGWCPVHHSCDCRKQARTLARDVAASGRRSGFHVRFTRPGSLQAVRSATPRMLAFAAAFSGTGVYEIQSGDVLGDVFGGLAVPPLAGHLE